MTTLGVDEAAFTAASPRSTTFVTGIVDLSGDTARVLDIIHGRTGNALGDWVSARSPQCVEPLMSVAAPPAESSASSADKTTPATGISELLGRVLEQLSLASRLSAAMLIGTLSILVGLHDRGSRSITDAITGLIGSTLGLLVVLLFALLLTAIITQAFEFEVIRLLEGYFTSLRGPVPKVVARRIRRHVVSGVMAYAYTLLLRCKPQDQELRDIITPHIAPPFLGVPVTPY